MIFFLLLIMLAPASLLAHSEAGALSPRVGPDQGVLEVDEHEGFVLRPSAEKNFAIQTMLLKAGPVWTVPSSALVYSGLETQVMRQRAGHWKSVDVDLVRRVGKLVELRSKELLAGDSLATQGIGFLKIIEQSVLAPSKDAHDD